MLLPVRIRPYELNDATFVFEAVRESLTEGIAHDATMYSFMSGDGANS